MPMTTTQLFDEEAAYGQMGGFLRNRVAMTEQEYILREGVSLLRKYFDDGKAAGIEVCLDEIGTLAEQAEHWKELARKLLAHMRSYALNSVSATRVNYRVMLDDNIIVEAEKELAGEEGAMRKFDEDAAFEAGKAAARTPGIMAILEMFLKFAEMCPNKGAAFHILCNEAREFIAEAEREKERKPS